MIVFRHKHFKSDKNPGNFWQADLRFLGSTPEDLAKQLELTERHWLGGETEFRVIASDGRIHRSYSPPAGSPPW